MEPLTRPLPLLPLGATAPDAVAQALRWLTAMANGGLDISLEPLVAPPVDAADRLALVDSPDRARCTVAKLAPAAAGPLLVVAPAGARPHCWQTLAGRRYALVPAKASVAIVAHELGHLLFGWPDLRLPPGSNVACLMAPLAGKDPARPCAPMRVAAGWEMPAPLVAGMAPAHMPESRAFQWADMLIERQGATLAGFRRSGRAATLAFACSIRPADSCALALASRSAR